MNTGDPPQPICGEDRTGATGPPSDDPAEHVLVIVPAYNEAEALGQVLDEVRAALPSGHILVVDDGSLDQTRAVGQAAGVDVLSLPFNLGVGGALRAGFRYTQRHDYRIAVQVDADGQHNPTEIDQLLAALDCADLVIGARFAGRGEYQVSAPRRAVMAVLSRVLSKRAGTQLTDTSSGFRAFGPAAVTLFAREYPVEYLGDTVEALLIACRAGLRITQVPVVMRARQAGMPSQVPLQAAVHLLRIIPSFLITPSRASGRRPVPKGLS